MPISIFFYLCLFLFILGYGWNAYQPNKAASYGSGLLLVLMLLFLGMQVFGGPVK